MVRNNAEAAAEFSRGGGHAVLLRAMQTRVDKLRVKAAFLLASLCADDDAVKDTLCDMGMPEQLAGLLRAEHDPTHEHLTSALLALVTDHARAAAECQREELGLRRLLEARVKELAGREECQVRRGGQRDPPPTKRKLS
ncbi:PREDICTED: hsp70-binding protein 1-like, partial [Priapulus caudatus]|uniref:Hsp70-binding protein 1-like n=1 Tax=Priapulus caudatus TaxID=37621 RepID=A0ABM1F7L4_PRICU